MKKYKFHILFVLLAAVAFLYFFRKKNNPAEKAPEAVNVPGTTAKLKTLEVSSVYFTDMENPDPEMWIGEKSSENKNSGSYSNKLSDQVEFGITFLKKGSEIPKHERIKQAKISFSLFSKVPLKKASLVYSVSGALDKMYDYAKEEIRNEANKWTSIEIIVPVNPGTWGPDPVVKIYPWNEGKELFFIDDIRIEFYTEEERASGIELGPQQNYYYNFEPLAGTPVPGNLSDKHAHSGKYSTVLSGADTYTENFIRKFSEVSADTVTFISTSVWIYPEQDDPVIALVVALENNNGKAITWQGKATDNMHLQKDRWHKINFRADLREVKLSPDDVSKVYLWNKKAGTIYIDDLEIVYDDAPKPKGPTTGIYINMLSDQTQLPGTNRPPFPRIQFSESPQVHPTTVYLINEEDRKEGDLDPANPVLAGNFCGHPTLQDDILIMGKNSWSLFSWCETSGKFVAVSTEPAPIGLAGKQIVTGFFKDPSKEQIILFDSTSKNPFQTIRFNRHPNSCEISSSTSKAEITTFEIPGFDPRGKAWKIVAGNFTGQHDQEILLISEDGDWKLIEMKNTSFGIAGSGGIGKGNILSVHALQTESRHERILVFSKANDKLDYAMMDLSGGAQAAALIELKDKSFLNFFSSNSCFYSGSFDKSAKPGIFYFNNDWRFDLKKLAMDPNGLTIESQVDFAPLDPARNPCFYEYTKMINGNFFGTGTDQILVMMRNCRDEDFDGQRCSEYEEIKDMPSGFLFFQYKKAD